MKREAFAMEGAGKALVDRGEPYRARSGGPQQTSIAVSRSITASVILRIACSERRAKGMSA